MALLTRYHCWRVMRHWDKYWREQDERNLVTWAERLNAPAACCVPEDFPPDVVAISAVSRKRMAVADGLPDKAPYIRCHAITRRGWRCSRTATADTDYCRQHRAAKKKGD